MMLSCKSTDSGQVVLGMGDTTHTFTIGEAHTIARMLLNAAAGAQASLSRQGSCMPEAISLDELRGKAGAKVPPNVDI
jgi:hypothetical protein